MLRKHVYEHLSVYMDYCYNKTRWFQVFVKHTVSAGAVKIENQNRRDSVTLIASSVITYFDPEHVKGRRSKTLTGQ